jgi:hypothetical protein
VIFLRAALKKIAGVGINGDGAGLDMQVRDVKEQSSKESLLDIGDGHIFVLMPIVTVRVRLELAP